MKYAILRKPHQNVRYFEAIKTLMVNEVIITAKGLKAQISVPVYESIGGLELLTFTCDELTPEFQSALGRVSSNLILFEVVGELLRPVMDGLKTYFPEDLSRILKYNGKTNEDFTSLMLTVAVMSSDFAGEFDQKLSILDPMCGRGTTLYESLIRGYDSAGVEQDKQAVSEVDKYLKRYLKYGKYKHEASHQTIHLSGTKNGTKYTIETADSAEHFKAKDRRTVQFASGDTAEVNKFYKKNSFHSVLTDLPYGVQHKGGERGVWVDLTQTLKKAGPEWFKMLRRGGTLVIAYNTYHLKRSELDPIFEAAGFTALNTGVYANFEHWVEQAVNRDILVYKK
ncbi:MULTISPECIES: TRM11 family methyltransferase [unclassified Fusibacter]|uniref:TRM11 family SAM-dependent methyltransferase n=1 Tax=unclassified Fusibacter TaxID=2624464 RepID=UPI001011FF06|nr:MULTISPECIES: hypothetical protein [unclassified Fusibacter]MCK8058674.1 hypothetical protein [Fusibacter sp. A2]NPE21749.1 hypothetical protein [Fusibacter sp. A1]RXV61323.1 hypothetical protein DWB64_07880 [Fusibacter sp. A1]